MFVFLCSVLLGLAFHAVSSAPSSCQVQVFDPVIDFFLKDYLPELVADFKFPDIYTEKVQMISPKIQGLNTIFRGCDTKATFAASSKTVSLKACGGIKELSLGGLVHVRTPLAWVPAGTLRIVLTDVVLQVGADVKLSAGSLPSMKELKIAKFGGFKLDTTGIFSGFDWLVNYVMNSSVKTTILGYVEKFAMGFSQGILKNVRI